jgi:hypothetical protein
MQQSLLEPVADQLQSANPANWPVAAGWQPLVRNFFKSEQGVALLHFLSQRLLAGASVFPPQPLRALLLTPPESVRLVILGQDPYHGRGQAEGLAFSVPSGVALPPSLRNIFKELHRDLGKPLPAFPQPGGSLARWAEEGVLLLNTCLTVEEGLPASHAKCGWGDPDRWRNQTGVRTWTAHGVHALGCPCPKQARTDRFIPPSGAHGQPSFALVGPASTASFHWMRTFFTSKGLDAGGAVISWHNLWLT